MTLTYVDLCAAAMDNQRMAYQQLELCDPRKLPVAWAYWSELQRESAREIEVYLTWLVHGPFRSEGGQSRCV